MHNLAKATIKDGYSGSTARITLALSSSGWIMCVTESGGYFKSHHPKRKYYRNLSVLPQ
jgi:hypothetical protein